MKKVMLLAILLMGILALTGCSSGGRYTILTGSTHILINHSEERNISDFYGCVQLRDILIHLPDFIPTEPKQTLTWYVYDQADEIYFNERNETEEILFTKEEVRNYFISECVKETSPNTRANPVKNNNKK